LVLQLLIFSFVTPHLMEPRFQPTHPFAFLHELLPTLAIDVEAVDLGSVEYGIVCQFHPPVLLHDFVGYRVDVENNHFFC
jgi:hypothetical protein